MRDSVPFEAFLGHNRAGNLFRPDIQSIYCIIYVRDQVNDKQIHRVVSLQKSVYIMYTIFCLTLGLLQQFGGCSCGLHHSLLLPPPVLRHIQGNRFINPNCIGVKTPELY